MTTLLSTLVLLLAALLAVLIAALSVADYKVAHAGGADSIDRWLLVGSYAAPSAIFVAGALVGAGLAWWVS